MEKSENKALEATYFSETVIAPIYPSPESQYYWYICEECEGDGCIICDDWGYFDGYANPSALDEDN